MNNIERKIQEVPLSKLKLWEKNPRKNDEAADRLAKLIEHHGFINPIIATPDGTIRAGNTRYKAAVKLKLETVPVIYVAFENEEEAIAYSISDNRASEFAENDIPKLQDLLLELKDDDFDIELAGFTDLDLKGFDIDLNNDGELDEDDIQRGTKSKKEVERDAFRLTLEIPIEEKAVVDSFLKDNGKYYLIEKVIELCRGG